MFKDIFKSDEERDAWLADRFPEVSDSVEVLWLLAGTRSESDKQLIQMAVAGMRMTAYLISKRRDLEVENTNLKDLLAAIDRRA